LADQQNLGNRYYHLATYVLYVNHNVTMKSMNYSFVRTKLFCVSLVTVGCFVGGGCGKFVLSHYKLES
jgi:hypothetical protein